jgi:hypothetical protein
MAKAVVEIDASTAGFDAAVASLPGKMDRAGSQLNKASGGFTRNLGGAAMQFQDIAVQLQMGTKASIVFAQQGSQLLSVFGAGGAIAGGAIAIGGALYTMGEASREAFEKATRGADEFAKNSSLIIQTTNAENLSGNLALVRQQFEELAAEREKLNTYMGTVAAYIGGGNPTDRRDALLERMQEMSGISTQMADQALSQSKQELEVLRLRAKGRADEADEMQRQIDLARKLASIDGMRLQDWQKNILKSQAVEKSDLTRPRTPPRDFFSSAVGGVSSFLGANAAPFKSALVSKLNEMAGASSSNTSSFARAAFSPLRGDADISTGRGRSVNPLVQNASRQIAEMTKQTTLLRDQAKRLGDSNKYLSSIEKIVGKLKFSPTYN